MEFYIAQAISILTLVVGIAMMQFKKMKWVLIGQIVANLLTASTYLLLGGFTGAYICLWAVVQALVMAYFDYKKKRPHWLLTLIFVLGYVGCSLLNFASAIDILAVLAAVCAAMSIAQQKSADSRRWYVWNPPLWMVYDVSTRAYGNLIMHGILLVSTLLAMIRNDGLLRRKKK